LVLDGFSVNGMRGSRQLPDAGDDPEHRRKSWHPEVISHHKTQATIIRIRGWINVYLIVAIIAAILPSADVIGSPRTNRPAERGLREMLIDTPVKPISRAPANAASNGVAPSCRGGRAPAKKRQ